MTDADTRKLVTALLLAVLVGVLAYAFLTMPDRRTPGQKISDAVNTLPQGVDKAARQLESRTPGEKLGDAVKDTGAEIKRSTQPPSQ
ncbi:MAG: hypothetical protein JO089_02045 [Alphaproteobacteria bacterium]|nr:hypothetical protein [Alphaproteobacteria bacterium]